MRLGFCAFVLVSACGSTPANPDAGVDAPAAPACNLAAPFDAPVAIAELNTADFEYAPRLSHDERTIYFTQLVLSGSGHNDLLTASRATATGTFGAAVKLALDGTDDEAYPSPTADGLTLYFSSNRAGVIDFPPNVFVATRATTTDEFAAVTNVAGVNGMSGQDSPYVMADGNTIYFASSRGKTGPDTDLYRATRSGGAFTVDTAPVFSALNGTSIERAPAVTPDELTIYFMSDRGSNYDIYAATRATKTDPFGAPVAVAELDTTALEEPGFVSDDGCRLYFSRSGAAGETDLYVASKPTK